MKLDRNVNQDGRGKYALINLRTNKVEWGGEGGAQFFVLKYRDKFAAPALRAYVAAARAEAERLREGLQGASEEARNRIVGDMLEWAEEVEREAVQAERSGVCVPS